MKIVSGTRLQCGLIEILNYFCPVDIMISCDSFT